MVQPLGLLAPTVTWPGSTLWGGLPPVVGDETRRPPACWIPPTIVGPDLGDRSIHDPEAKGLDKIAKLGYKNQRAGIAQLVEYELPKLGVAGSSPVARSRSENLGRAAHSGKGYRGRKLTPFFRKKIGVFFQIRMEARAMTKALWEIIEPVVTSEGMELVELEFQREAHGWVLRLFIDRQGGVTVRDCAEISQQVSHLLDVKDPIDRSYHLEVSSPGLDRPIRKLEDFKRFVGQKVKIALCSGGKRRKALQGMVVDVEGDSVLVDCGLEVVRVPLDDIAKARLVYPWGDRYTKGVT